MDTIESMLAKLNSSFYKLPNIFNQKTIQSAEKILVKTNINYNSLKKVELIEILKSRKQTFSSLTVNQMVQKLIKLDETNEIENISLIEEEKTSKQNTRKELEESKN